MVKFIIDSTFGVSKEYCENHDIKTVSLQLLLDGETTLEGFEESWEEFYLRYEKSKNFPTTSQPNPYSFQCAIDKILENDPKADIIILTIGGSLSGTINSATIAAEAYPDHNIKAIDSQNASAASAMLLYELVKFTENGGSYEDAIELSSKLISKLSAQFVPDTMKYLRKGGRIGFLGALLASIISIKPIFDFRDNVISLPKKAHGIVKALKEMILRLPKKIKELKIVYIYRSTHVELMKQKLEELLGLTNVEVIPVSPTFGIHVGIGTIGLACLEE